MNMERAAEDTDRKAAGAALTEPDTAAVREAAVTKAFPVKGAVEKCSLYTRYRCNLGDLNALSCI